MGRINSWESENSKSMRWIFCLRQIKVVLLYCRKSFSSLVTACRQWSCYSQRPGPRRGHIATRSVWWNTIQGILIISCFVSAFSLLFCFIVLTFFHISLSHFLIFDKRVPLAGVVLLLVQTVTQSCILSAASVTDRVKDELQMKCRVVTAAQLALLQTPSGWPSD